MGTTAAASLRVSGSAVNPNAQHILPLLHARVVGVGVPVIGESLLR
jgi:hypothetical protein